MQSSKQGQKEAGLPGDDDKIRSGACRVKSKQSGILNTATFCIRDTQIVRRVADMSQVPDAGKAMRRGRATGSLDTHAHTHTSIHNSYTNMTEK